MPGTGTHSVYRLVTQGTSTDSVYLLVTLRYRYTPCVPVGEDTTVCGTAGVVVVVAAPAHGGRAGPYLPLPP